MTEVLAPGREKLQILWHFCGEAWFVRCLLEQKGCPLGWDGGTLSLCARCHESLVDKASVSTATPNRYAILSSRVEQGKGGCAQYCDPRTPA